MVNKKVLVCCGTGIATSVQVANKLQRMLRDRGITATMKECKTANVPAQMTTFQPDAIVVTDGSVEPPSGGAIHVVLRAPQSGPQPSTTIVITQVPNQSQNHDQSEWFHVITAQLRESAPGRLRDLLAAFRARTHREPGEAQLRDIEQQARGVWLNTRL